jgi:hypothetical protein
MATTKAKKIYVSVKIGEYKVKTKAGERTKVVVSQIDQKVATFLGVTGSIGGLPVERTIKKGASAGAKYTSYLLGTKGRGFKLAYNAAEAGALLPGQGRKRATVLVNIPVPTGTPLSVIAAFAAQKLKGKSKPQRIISPNGASFYLNTSKASQG